MNRKNLRLCGKRLIAVLCTLLLLFGMIPVGVTYAAGEVTVSFSSCAQRTSDWLLYADVTGGTVDTSVADGVYLNTAVSGVYDDGSTQTSFNNFYVYRVSDTRIFYVLDIGKTAADVPTGATLTVNGGSIGSTLTSTNTITMVWSGSEWKELRELTPQTITTTVRTDVFITTHSELAALYTTKGSAYNLAAVGTESGVYYNGEITSTTIQYSQYGGLYFDAGSIKGSNFEVGDVVSLKGVFSQTVDSDLCYKLDDSFICTAVGTTNANGLTSATWVHKGELVLDNRSSSGQLILTGGEKYVAEEKDVNAFTTQNVSGVFYNDTWINMNFTWSKWGYFYIYPSSLGVTEFSQGDVVCVKGTMSFNGYSVNFGDNWFVYDNGAWLHYTEEPETDISFTITSGSYGFQDWNNLNRWAMTFEPSESLGAQSALTYLGDYQILVDGEETKAPFYVTTDGKLQMFIGQSIIPQVPVAGTRMTIPAQQIGEGYALTEDYSIIYDGGWKTYTAYVDTTLSVHTTWGSQNLQATLYPNEAEATAATLTLSSGTYFTQVGEDAGIWYNGEKLAASPGLKTTVAVAESYVRYHVVLSDYGLTVNTHDIITIKGLFKNNGVYLNFSEINLKYNGTNWETVSYGYEDLTVFSLDKLLNAEYQNTDTQQRWLFKMQPSVTLEAATASWGNDYVGYSGNMPVQIYHEDMPETVTEITSAALHAVNDAQDGYFGFILNFTDLPMEADGYVMVIKPGIFKSTNYIYMLEKEFKIINVNGTWEMIQERPASTDMDGDANGDGVVDVRDIVREKLELAGLTLCTEDAFLNGRTSILREVDLISLYEIILRGNIEDNDMPIYLEDDKIMLAAYEGPRKAGGNDYSLSGLTITGTPVATDFLTAEEFKRYADAGLNTLIAQADCDFNSRLLYQDNIGTGYWDNMTKYMQLAEDANLDVIAYSNMLDQYLRDYTTYTFDGTTVDVSLGNVKTEVGELWEGITFGGNTYKGMKDYGNFVGMLMSDELKSADKYKLAVETLKEISPDIGYFSSQYSMDASVIGGADGFNTQAKNFGTAAGNFVYDFYPLRTNASGTASTESNWLYNLQLSAQAGLDNGFETGITVQSNGSRRGLFLGEYLRETTATEDIGFQVYTSLAYGMKSITYYTYWEHHHQYYDSLSGGEYMSNAMVVYDGNGDAKTTDIYNAVQTVNNQINKFDHVFMEYDWLGTVAVNNQNNSSMYGSLASYDYAAESKLDLTSHSATGGDALIGCMYDSTQGYDGYWLVNGTSPDTASDTTITVKFDGATRLMVYDPTEEGFNGSAKIVSYDAENGYTADLSCGEGHFVIPLK